MNKATRILLALGLILAVATPALAEIKLNGFYRLMGYSAEVRSGASLTGMSGNANAVSAGFGVDDEEGDSQSMIDQRLRLMMTYSLNDNVSIVYQAEIDNQWGETTKGGNGGKVGSDATNVETKHAYLSLKAGDTAATIGMQGAADPIQGILFNDDMAGIVISHKIGGTTLNGIYSKWDEGNRSYWDDSDLYGAYVTQKFSDNLTAGALVYFQDNNSASPNVAPNAPDFSETFTYGLTADAKFGNFGLDGFVAAQDGSFKFTNSALNSDLDMALAGSLKGTMKLDNGNVGLRFIYFSEQDEIDELDDDTTFWQGFQGQYEYVNENLMQFLTDKFVCNYGKERYAIRDAVNNGFGLYGLVASGNHTLPESMYVNWGLGYFRAITDNVEDDVALYGDDQDYDDVDGKTLGWEAAVRVGKKYFEKVDVSLNLSYADYGNFYDNSAYDEKTDTDEDPDATYKAYLMVNVPF